MVDIVSKKTRSRMMSGIRGKDTKPELLIRSGLHKRGFRFRLHYGQLPGKPDLVFPKYRAIILINGCFWHGHDCHLFKWPSTRTEFWRNKITSNQVRDERNIAACRGQGWRTLVIWECALKGKVRRDPTELAVYAAKWLTTGSSDAEIAGERSS
jgi:DNA mismatch endonuclease (patch repair protein)